MPGRRGHRRHHHHHHHHHHHRRHHHHGIHHHHRRHHHHHHHGTEAAGGGIPIRFGWGFMRRRLIARPVVIATAATAQQPQTVVVQTHNPPVSDPSGVNVVAPPYPVDPATQSPYPTPYPVPGQEQGQPYPAPYPVPGQVQGQPYPVPGQEQGQPYPAPYPVPGQEQGQPPPYPDQAQYQYPAATPDGANPQGEAVPVNPAEQEPQYEYVCCCTIL